MQIDTEPWKLARCCTEHGAERKINLVIAYSDSTLVKNTFTYVQEKKNQEEELIFDVKEGVMVINFNKLLW